MSSISTNDETDIISTSSVRDRMLAAATQTNLEPVSTIIDESGHIKGNIASREDMLINGRVEGSIAIKNNRLEIGPTGHIEANVFAKVVTISGELKGDIYASEQAVITKTGRVYGNIFASDVNIEDGALIKGNIDMEKQDISHHPLIPDFHDDEHAKSGSFSSLFKRMRGKHHSEATITSIETSACKTSIEEILHLAAHSNIIQDTDAPISIIGETVMIKGEIMSEKNMVILGQIDGTIHFKNCNLLVGHNALIRSNIYTKSIITQGEISGDIHASEKAIIKKPGHVSGNVHAPAVSIESGAILMGTIDMEPQDVENAYANAARTSAANAIQDKKAQLPHTSEISDHAASSSHNESAHLVDTSWPKYVPRS